MKKNKLIYNKNTNELGLQENKSLKNWLQENKIYFETIMTISITLMGIIVSFISLSIDKNIADIQKEQLELQRLSIMPIFNVSSTKRREEYVVDGIRYDPCIEYEIVNNGGNIYDGYLRAEGRIEIIVKNGEQDILIILRNKQRFLKSYSYYNANSQSFVIKRDFDNRNIELKNYLYNIFMEKNINAKVVVIDYINIRYTDIEKNFHNEWYELNGDELLVRQPEIGDYIMSLQVNTMKNEEISDKILKIINEINQ